MPMPETTRYIPSRAVVGPYGLPAVSRGYTEIDCTDGKLRIYDDQVVIGPRGERVISRGKTEIAK